MKAIYNDGQNLTSYVQNRLELAWGDILTDGKLTINENGFQGEADFGVPSSRRSPPAPLWSNTSAPRRRCRTCCPGSTRSTQQRVHPRGHPSDPRDAPEPAREHADHQRHLRCADGQDPR
jgi:hypothetical protein